LAIATPACAAASARAELRSWFELELDCVACEMTAAESRLTTSSTPQTTAIAMPSSFESRWRSFVTFILPSGR
jgi:hypothetical protein